MTDPSQLRIGDRERDAVAAVLTTAVGDGRLTITELDERMHQLYAATTFADLDPIVADLPVARPSAALLARATMAPEAPAAASLLGGSAERPVVLSAGWSTAKRTGVWDIPPYLRLEPGAGSIILNCLQARPLAPVISVEVRPGAGTVKLIVPQGWGANIDSMRSGMGSIRSDLPTSATAGYPQLVLHGGTGMGSVRIRYPRRGELRAAGLA